MSVLQTDRSNLIRFAKTVRPYRQSPLHIFAEEAPLQRRTPPANRLR